MLAACPIFDFFLTLFMLLGLGLALESELDEVVAGWGPLAYGTPSAGSLYAEAMLPLLLPLAEPATLPLAEPATLPLPEPTTLPLDGAGIPVW